jgi:putative transposase
MLISMKRRGQLAFDLRYKGRGGPRKGAGRPRKQPGTVPHLKRPALSRHHPVHVTLRFVEGLASVRSRQCYRAVLPALEEARERDGFRVVELSLQSNHMHLIAEADDQTALSRGIQALAIRVAKRLNAALGRHGKVFAQRFHMHVLKTVREVVNAVDYVLSNWFRHAGRQVGIDDIDRLSSAGDRSLVVRPQTWLLRMAWTKAG